MAPPHPFVAAHHARQRAIATGMTVVGADPPAFVPAFASKTPAARRPPPTSAGGAVLALVIAAAAIGLAIKGAGRKPPVGKMDSLQADRIAADWRLSKAPIDTFLDEEQYHEIDDGYDRDLTSDEKSQIRARLQQETPEREHAWKASMRSRWLESGKSLDEFVDEQRYESPSSRAPRPLTSKERATLKNVLTTVSD